MEESTGNSIESTAINNDNNINSNSEANNLFSKLKTLLTRLLTIYFFYSIFFRKSKDVNHNVIDKVVYTNMFKDFDLMDMHIFLNENPQLTSHDNAIFYQSNLIFNHWNYGDFGNSTFIFKKTLIASESLQNNGSYYIHFCITKKGEKPSYFNLSSSTQPTSSCISKSITKYMKIKEKNIRNLLDSTEKIKTSPNVTIVSHWHQSINAHIIFDQTAWVKDSIPDQLKNYFQFHHESLTYSPILMINDYWNYISDYRPISSLNKTLDIEIMFYPISMFKWQMYVSQEIQSQWSKMLSFTEQNDEDKDTLKRTLLETNPYLICLTIMVSLLHTFFEFLAFKNDIQFWNTRKSLEGLSVRSICMNIVQSFIVFLYVLDNDTNVMIILSCGVGLLIDAWKITKVLSFQVIYSNSFFPKIVVTYGSSYSESVTKKYDLMAFKYLSWVMGPLFISYIIYSLLYLEHKGWYSWVIGVVYGFLLTFGFIMMTPQLFINYKMKSVAHLPWRMLTYKALNTFIDDMFAFVIKMPMLYRIGCLRDDVIFIIYLYQRFKYPTDMSRINEFGTKGSDDVQNSQVRDIKEIDNCDSKPKTE